MGGFVRWIKGFVRELRRRRVIRVAVVYAGTGFVILEAADILQPALRLPSWTVRLIAVLLILGFPLAVGLAWVYNITEEGLARTEGKGDASGEIGPEGKPFTSNAVIIGLLAVAIGLLLYPRLTGSPQQIDATSEEAAAAEDTVAADLDPQSVAVLPFPYLAAEDSADYLSIGMTDEIIGRLSQIEDLSVRGRTSVMRYQDTDKPIPQISKELNVAHVVEGSVTKTGGQIRVQIQLLDGRTDEHLWSQGFTRPFENVLQLQVDLAREVAGQLEATLLPETEKQMASAAPVDSAAYTLYLQGRRLRFRAETGPDLTRAIRLLRQSISIDSTFAPAWATLSTSAILTSLFGGYLPEGLSTDSLAKAAARRALELDSTSAEAHIAMGVVRQVLDHNFPAAGPHFKRAVELSPGLANAHREYGLYLMRMAQFEAAERYLKKAARLDPAAPAPWHNLGWNYLWRGNYQEARRHFERALTLEPNYWLAHRTLVEVHLAEGKMEAALREARRAVEVNRSPYSLGELGRAYARAGRPDSARVVLERLREDFGHSPVREAVIYAALGETGQALDRLEEAGGWDGLKASPRWEPLQGEPRYERLLEQMGLDEATVQQTMKKLGPDPPDASTDQSQEGSGTGI